jgi:hypothetical protein
MWPTLGQLPTIDNALLRVRTNPMNDRADRPLQDVTMLSIYVLKCRRYWELHRRYNFTGPTTTTVKAADGGISTKDTSSTAFKWEGYASRQLGIT